MAVLVGLALAYTAFGFWGVPRIADRVIRAQVEKLGLKAEVGAIRFHPYRLDAQIEQLRISEASGAPLLGFARLDVDFELWASIRERGAAFKHLRLDAPDVSLVVDAQGKVNLAQLAPPASEQPGTESPSTIPNLLIGELAIREGRVGIEDRSRPEPFALELRPLEFALRDFRTAQGHGNVYAFSAAASTGERIEWSGDFTVQPLGSKGRFAVQNAQASTATAYLQDQLPVRLLSGVAETAGEYQLSLDPTLALDVNLPLLSVRELSLGEYGRNDDEPSVSAGEIAVADIALSLAQREVRVGGIDVRGLSANLRREADGGINLAKLVAPGKPEPEPEADVAAPAAARDAETEPETANADTAPPDANWRVMLGGARVHAASITAEDRAVKPAVRLALTPIDLEVGALTSELREPVSLKAGLGIGKRGRLEATGTLGMAPMTAVFDLDARQLDLSVLRPYLAEVADLDSARLGLRGAVEWAQSPAKLSFKGQLDVADIAARERQTRLDIKTAKLGVNGALTWRQAPARVAFDGDVDLDRVALRDPARKLAIDVSKLGVRGALTSAGSPAQLKFDGNAQCGTLAVRRAGQKDALLGWQALRVDGIAYAQARNRLDIARVDLVGPRARAEISPQRELNLTQAFATPEAQAPAPATAKTEKPDSPAAPALAMELKTLRIQRGTLDFADRSIEPQFAANIQKLEGRIEGLSTRAQASAKVDLKGQVDEFSPVLISGQLSPLAYERDTTLALSFRNMDLIRFNPYSGRFAGYNIEKGKLSTELRYRIQEGALQAEHHVVVDQLEFGEATGSKDAVPLPVKLAVALLKDRHGVIDLSLPVSGRLDDPQFRVGPLVWKVLTDLLAKAVTAPFAALGALFGGGEEMQFVSFAPGQATLDDAQRGKVEQLARALVERPALKLDVPYALADEADAQALAEAELAREFAALPPAPSAEVRLEILSAMHARRLGLRPVFPAEAPELDAAARTQARLAFVEAAVLTSLRPDAAALETLAAERARSVQSALLAQAELAPERVFLTSRRAGKADDTGQVRMELKLE